jgi:hypothetical protein
MIKLIITDLDGTLLNDEKTLSPIFWETEQAIHAKGILFSIASGRQFHNLLEKFDRIKERTLFIAENGTYASYQGKEIFVNALGKAETARLIEIGKRLKGSHMIVCGKNSAYTESADSRFLSEARKYYSRLKIVNDLFEVEDDVLKVTICDFSGAEKHRIHFQACETEYQIALATKIWLDFTHLSANKGTAIAKVQQDLGISFDETMVFGDYLNDLEMMKSAKHSYAMKNAHPQIIEAANFVTEFDNNNEGVERMIKKVCGL